MISYMSHANDNTITRKSNSGNRNKNRTPANIQMATVLSDNELMQNTSPWQV